MAIFNLLVSIVIALSCAYATEVRLNGSAPGAGRLEINENEAWIAVSGIQLSAVEMRVVCRSAGLPGDNPKYFTYVENDHHIYKVLDIRCIGNETNIDQCVQGGVEWDQRITYVVCQEFQFRLTGGGGNDGIVEVKDGSSWRHICTDKPFDRDQANLICRKMGLASSHALSVDVARYPMSSAMALPIQMSCVGVENKTNCSFEKVLRGSRCSTNRIMQGFAAVLCSEDPLQYRLADNDTTHSGRFEILVNNTWGPVCTSLFTSSTAAIACKSLGLPSSDARFTMGEYNGGRWAPSLKSGGCDGTETALVECSFATWAPARCFSSMFVSLRCTQGSGEGQVRLNGGFDNISGNVEIYHNGSWGGFCFSGFDGAAADIICRNVTSPVRYSPKLASSASLGYGHIPLAIENITCTENEDNLLDCDHSAFGDVHNCYGWNIANAGVVCGYMDERLDLDARTGLLMVRHNRKWGTFCGKAFQTTEARVACKTLGLPSSFAQRKSEPFYQQERSGRIWLQRIKCRGDESSLFECPMNEWGKVRCGHQDDVFLSCRDINTVPINYTFRGDPMTNVGYLLMKVDGQWGSVCDDGFGTMEAQVACRSMGLRTDGAKVISASNTEFASKTIFSPPKKFWLDDLNCDGTETSLMKCQHNYIGDNDCHAGEAVILYCGPPDGNNYDVRLVGGNDANSGRVEMKMYGQWGTLCKDRVTRAAEVICRHLGKPSSGATTTTKFGSGTGMRWVDRIVCYATETSLADCSHYNYGRDDCTHLDDLGVECKELFSNEHSYDHIGGLPSGAIVGVAMGCVGLIIFVISMIVFAASRQRQRNVAASRLRQRNVATTIPVQYIVQGFVEQNAAPQYNPGMFDPPPSYNEVVQSKQPAHDHSARPANE